MGRLSRISWVTRWQPLRLADRWNVVCLIMENYIWVFAKIDKYFEKFFSLLLFGSGVYFLCIIKKLKAMIQSAKVTFSKIGVISAKVTSSKNGVASQEKKGTLFMPRVVLQIEGRKSLKTGYLQLSRFDKKDYQGLAVLPDFIVIITKQEYITVGEDIEERKAISRSEAGEIVDVQEDGFICRIGNKIQLRNIDCEMIGERDLTEEEIRDLEQENN